MLSHLKSAKFLVWWVLLNEKQASTWDIRFLGGQMHRCAFKSLLKWYEAQLEYKKIFSIKIGRWNSWGSSNIDLVSFLLNFVNYQFYKNAPIVFWKVWFNTNKHSIGVCFHLFSNCLRSRMHNWIGCISFYPLCIFKYSIKCLTCKDAFTLVAFVLILSIVCF